MTRRLSPVGLAGAFTAALLLGAAPAPDPPARYSIEAVRYGTVRDFRVAGLVMGAPGDERMDIAMAFWLIREEYAYSTGPAWREGDATGASRRRTSCRCYANLATRTAGATFLPEDRAGDEAALDRMERLARSAARVVPGHDPLQFQRFSTRGRPALIREPQTQQP